MTMDEKVKVRFAVPETLAESANRFLKSLAYPTQKPDGELSPPIPISVERKSGLLGDYFVESLKFRSLGVAAGGSPRAMAVEVLAIPIKPMRKIDGKLGGCLTCDGSGWERWPELGLARVCPSCERCPECGGSGVGNTPGALACEDLCARCAGKGRVPKDEPGPLGFRGDVEKGPADEAVTVENEEEFKGEFGDGETFQSDPKKQELKRRILDRMTGEDMLSAVNDACDLPNLADILVKLLSEEEILDMTSSIIIERDGEKFGESKLPSALLSAKGVAELKDRFEERHRGTKNADRPEMVSLPDDVLTDSPEDECPECPDCLGTGKKFIEEPDEKDCEKCNGTGKREREDE